ncbi:polymorphic toxin type 15 domain-containing protein [Enterococcus quebecensis]|uniref:polymorphic toxin type 15 domain-containing protein n=3 Tax=Enterococcus quebecensis TaxID=903983 RepID=UPI0009F51142|nr:polymorphic toxin type 15 domain-containing protein [Enterococcus quebecensis]
MGFHVETAEMKKALEQYQKLSKTAQEQLDNAKSSMNGIINSNAMHGQVGQAIAADINNNKNAVLVGLKNSYKLVEADLQQTYADFAGTTGETSQSAVLDEDVLTKAKTAIDKFKTEHKEKRQTIKSTYSDIADLISLSMPSSSTFTSACDEAKKQLDKIIQKVNEFDSKQQPSSAEEIINVLSQQIKMSETASGLSYTDPRFMEFVSQTELAEAIKDIDSQIIKAEADAKLAAEKAAKEKQEQWAKHHPVENFLQNMSDSIGDWWGNVVQGTKNLSIPKGFKDILLFGEGFLGGAGEMVSSVAIGGSQVIHLGVELVEWGLDSARGIETPQWKLDDIKGAWENTKAIGKTLNTLGMGIQAATNPWLLAVSPTHREALKETFDMGAGIVNTIVNDIKTGNAYAIGGYVFDVASMFVGVGEVNAALKGTKVAGKIAEGLNAFKATTKATTLGKLGKVTSMVDKGLKYGDDALKAFMTKVKNIPMPIMDEIALAGGGSVKVVGKGTLDDYMKAAKANFSKGSKLGNKLDDFAAKLDEIEVSFKKNAKHDAEEFARQLKNQEKGMNELTVEEYLANRERYLAEGRALEGNIAQQAAREQAYTKKLNELQKSGKTLSQAKSEAKQWLDKQAALHNPDQIAGGKANIIGGMGDKGINSSLGSQWRYRIEAVDEQIRAMAKNMTPEQLKNTHLNVKLTQ